MTFDVTGLPPTRAEIDAFLADPSTAAYERVVERLLASPRYGERWARHWLDLVRYAETHGHEFDFDMPNAYRYRDYAIRAFNADVPFNQFVIEHLAGDLLSNPRRNPSEGFDESIIGTGFFFFGEAKHSPVDVRQDEADRIDNQIDVLAKTFLALTVSCARCHDHKFDPISTKDYYALAGYLQSSRYQQAFIDPIESIAPLVAELKQVHDERQRLVADFARWSLTQELTRLADTMLDRGSSAGQWADYLRDTARAQVDDVFHAWAVLSAPPSPADTSAVASFADRRASLDAQLKAAANAATPAYRLFADFSSGQYGDWQTTGAAFGEAPLAALDWTFAATAGPLKAEVASRATAHSGQLSPRLRGTLRSPTFEITEPAIFYRVGGRGVRVRLILDGLQLIQNPIYGGLNFEPQGPRPRWHRQDVSKWLGHRAYIEVLDEGDGFAALEQVVFGQGDAPRPVPNALVAEMLDNATIDSPATLAARYQALVQQVFTEWLAEPRGLRQHAADRAAIVNWVFEHCASAESLRPRLDELAGQLAAVDRRHQEIESRLPAPRQAMALADGTAENEHVFIRGSHKNLGDEVPRRFLEIFGGGDHAAPAAGSGRLELARELVTSGRPLVARVIVNRLWKHHFGEGLVSTCDDFGAMGQKPTNPELLDYLAAELVRSGWSLKGLHRQMLLSATYQMASRPTAEADRLDPQNKLWHRMSIRRLEAEAIRDAILAVSGSANETMYGPGVAPYLTDFMSGRGRPKASGPLDGDARRSIYLAVRRNFLPPMFLAFDYPTPFTTIGRRGVSNVPAQALAMLNNPFVVEQAGRWATRVLGDGGRPTIDRVRDMYWAALGRAAGEGEERAAMAFFAAEGGQNENDPAAWADFAHVMFNLKEFIFVP